MQSILLGIDDSKASFTPGELLLFLTLVCLFLIPLCFPNSRLLFDVGVGIGEYQVAYC